MPGDQDRETLNEINVSFSQETLIESLVKDIATMNDVEKASNLIGKSIANMNEAEQKIFKSELSKAGVNFIIDSLSGQYVVIENNNNNNNKKIIYGTLPADNDIEIIYSSFPNEDNTVNKSPQIHNHDHHTDHDAANKTANEALLKMNGAEQKLSKTSLNNLNSNFKQEGFFNKLFQKIKSYFTKKPHKYEAISSNIGKSLELPSNSFDNILGETNVNLNNITLEQNKDTETTAPTTPATNVGANNDITR